MGWPSVCCVPSFSLALAVHRRRAAARRAVCRCACRALPCARLADARPALLLPLRWLRRQAAGARERARAGMLLGDKRRLGVGGGVYKVLSRA